MKNRSLRILVLTLCSAFPLFGQQGTPSPSQTSPPDDKSVVRIVVNLVQVDALVTDKSGKQVVDLKAEDFEILQDGKPQAISNFSYITTGPAAGTSAVPNTTQTAVKGAPPTPPVRLRPEQVRRTMAFVVDDLGLSFESVAYVRQALKQFVNKQMQPGDLVAIIRTSAGMGALQQFTADKHQLNAAIERVRFNLMGRSQISAFAPIRSTPSADGTSGAEDRLDQFRTEIFSVGTLGAIQYVVGGLKEIPGRKSVVLLSDGFRIFGKDQDNTRVLDSLKRLTDLANRASVVIYTIDARGLQTLGLTAADNTTGLSNEQLTARVQERQREHFETQDGLNYLAQETGGIFYYNSNDIGGQIGQVLDDQKGYYLIGYQPDETTFRMKDGRQLYHRISVRVKRPGLNVRSRNGFYGVPDDPTKPMPQTRVDQLRAALTSPFAGGGLSLRLTSLFGYVPKQGSIIRSVLHIDAHNLSFTKDEEGWNTTVLDFLAVTFGADGAIVDQMNQTYTVKIRGGSYDAALKNGLIYNLTVPVKKPGAYQLRVAVRDSARGQVGSASQFIEVPDIRKGHITLSGIAMNGSSPASSAKPAAVAKTATPAPVGTTGDGQVQEPDPEASLAVRRFQSGMFLHYVVLIYNAKLDHNGGRPQLEYQLRLYREGAPVYTSPKRPVALDGQTDLSRIMVGGQVNLASKMAPGDYVLQIIVDDKLAKEKNRTATQWLDFEIAP